MNREEAAGPTLPVPRSSRGVDTLAWPGPAGLPVDPHSWEPPGMDRVDSAEPWGPVLLRRRWVVLGVMVVTILTTLIWTVTTRPVYTATVTMRIEKEEPHVLTFGDVARGPDPLPDYLQTQQKLIESRTSANRVIKLLSLDEHPDFREPEDVSWLGKVRAWVRTQLTGWIPEPPTPAPGTADDLVFQSPITRVFLSRLSVEPVRSSRLVKISFESHYPALAARVANTVAEVFLARSLEMKAEAGQYAASFLAKHMEDVRGNLEQAEEKLNTFLKIHGINFVATGTSTTPDRVPERQDLVTQQLGVLSEALLKARNERIAKESLLQQAREQDTDSLPAVLQNPVIVKLRGDLAGLEAQSQELGQTFKPEYPKMQRLQHSINEVRAQISAEVKRVVKGLEADYRAAAQNEHQIETAMEGQRNRALRLGDQLVQYNILRRDVDTSRELYTSLLTRLKETQVSANLLTSPISIVDRAEVPLQPARPRKSLSLVLASVVGLLGGVGLAFVSERLDRRIRSVGEVERVLRVRRLGLVPEGAGMCGRDPRRRDLPWRSSRLPFALVTHIDSASVSAEAFRELRTRLLYSMPERPPRTIMVTSLEAGDGKTSLATNLAIALAQLGAGEVLLLDGNLRHPELHTLLDVPRSPGLSTFLAGQAELPAVLKPTEVPNLYLIPAGRLPTNPAELLASRRLVQALEALAERFEHIVFDTPPLFGVSDALNLAPRLEGVILVLRHGRASRDAAQEALQRLAFVRANLLGVVVNGVARGATARGYGPPKHYDQAPVDDDQSDDDE